MRSLWQRRTETCRSARCGGDGVPVVACDCATSRSEDPRDKRWSPSLVSPSTAPPACWSPRRRTCARAVRFRLERVDAILLTHAPRRPRARARRRPNLQLPLGGSDSLLRCRAGAGPRTPDFEYVFDPATPKGGGLPQLALREVIGDLARWRDDHPGSGHARDAAGAGVSDRGLRLPDRLQRDSGRLVAAARRPRPAGVRRRCATRRTGRTSWPASLCRVSRSSPTSVRSASWVATPSRLSNSSTKCPASAWLTNALAVAIRVPAREKRTPANDHRPPLVEVGQFIEGVEAAAMRVAGAGVDVLELAERGAPAGAGTERRHHLGQRGDGLLAGQGDDRVGREFGWSHYGTVTGKRSAMMP